MEIYVLLNTILGWIVSRYINCAINTTTKIAVPRVLLILTLKEQNIWCGLDSSCGEMVLRDEIF